MKTRGSRSCAGALVRSRTAHQSKAYAFSDSNGHDYGSAMISRIGQVIARNFYPSDIAARYAEMSFLCCWRKPNRFMQSSRLSSSPGCRADSALLVPAGARPVTISIGISCFSDHGVRVGERITWADQALYTSKKEGKIRATVAEPPGEITP